MASLVDQIFQQSQAGSAGGESFFDAYLAGKQGAQRDRQLAMQEQELNATLAQLPLNLLLKQQETQLNEYNLTDKLQQRQNYVSSTGAFADLNARVSPLLESGQLEEAVTEHARAGLSNNFMLTDPRYAAMGKQLQALQREADLASYRLALGDAATQRAEAAKLRADVATSNLALEEAKLQLNKQREQRLQATFDLKLKDFERNVPQDRLTLFRAKAAQIRNDITLLADPDKAAAKLDELARELGIGQIAAPQAAPTAPTKVRVIAPDGRVGNIPASQLDTALKQGYKKVD